mgnify:CR=1 FL=1
MLGGAVGTVVGAAELVEAELEYAEVPEEPQLLKRRMTNKLERAISVRLSWVFIKPPGL